MVERLSWQGVTKFTNFVYQHDGLEVTCGYKIGTPQRFSYKTLLKNKKAQDTTKVAFAVEYARPNTLAGTLGQSAVTMAVSVTITCLEPTCSKTFKTQEDLDLHIAAGKHSLDLVDTKFDTIARKWASTVSDVTTTTRPMMTGDSDMSPATNPVPAGWAVKAPRQSKRFAQQVKDFLFEEFMRGANTGKKENPGLVAKKIKNQFERDDWLTTQQVSSYFSRLAAQQKCGRLTRETADKYSEDDHQLAASMMTRSKQRAEIIEQIDL
ncbi:uncharacterized protein LOC135503235 [Lineus longissimus]|uniref:uncharacterized protein LOC135503235 n=1 Tax=Lineus longissimus TaxID=88925 RepID=UPI00315CBC21